MALAIEESVYADIFFSGIDHVEKLDGGLLRIVLYVDRAEPDGTTVRVIVAKLVQPAATLPAALRLLGDVLSQNEMPFISDGGMIKPLDS